MPDAIWYGPRSDFEQTRAEIVEAERVTGVCLAGNARLEADLIAAHQHVAALETPADSGPPWWALPVALLLGVVLGGLAF